MSDQSIAYPAANVRSVITGVIHDCRLLLKRFDRPLALIVLLSMLVNLVGVNWGLPSPDQGWWYENHPSDFVWAHDAIAPVSPLAAARDFFAWGWWSRGNYIYPLFHYILLALLYTPPVVYWFLSGQFAPPAGPGYPYGLTNPEDQLALLEMIARLTSAVMASSIVVFIYLIGKRLYGRRAGLLAALMTSLCYTFVFYAHTSNLEVPSLFWGVIALYFYLKLVDGEQRSRNYLGFGILAAIAMSTKDQAYGLFVLPIVHILYAHYRHCAPGSFSPAKLFRSFIHRDIVYAVAGFVIAYAIANNVFFNLPRLWTHFQLLFGGPNAWPSPDRYLPDRSLVSQYFLLKLTAYHTIHSLGLPMAFVCAVGLIYCLYRWPKRTLLISLPAISFYVFFINAALFYVHPRYTLPLALTLSLFGGKLLADMFQRLGAIRVVGYAFAVLVFTYSFAYSLSLDLTLINDSRQLATAWIQKHVPSGATIEVYTPSCSLPYFSHGYQVHSYPWQLDERLPATDADYLVITERVYRGGSDISEREAFEEALQKDGAFKELLSGTAGYKLQTEFHYRVHDLLFTDIIYSINPRIFIFKKERA